MNCTSKAIHFSYKSNYGELIKELRSIGITNGVAEPLAGPSADVYASAAYGRWYNNAEYFVNGTEAWNPPVPAYLITNRSNTTPLS